MIKQPQKNATPLVAPLAAALLLSLFCTILSACSTTQEPLQYSMRSEFCDEADATNLDCQHVNRSRDELGF
jgi:hypothetical protein